MPKSTEKPIKFEELTEQINRLELVVSELDAENLRSEFEIDRKVRDFRERYVVVRRNQILIQASATVIALIALLITTFIPTSSKITTWIWLIVALIAISGLYVKYIIDVIIKKLYLEISRALNRISDQDF